MALIEEMEQVGNVLFRWRSYLPFVMVPLFFSGLRYFSYPLGSHTLNQYWELLCLAVSFTGLGVRIFTVGYTPKGTSGRNTKKQGADTLNTTGLYSVVRNPLYVGNFLIGLGVSLFVRVWWVSLIYLLAFMVYYERIIIAEEMYLRRKFGQQFLDFASKTPAFLPRFKNWCSPDMSFSWRKVLRREYQTLFEIITIMFFMELFTEIHLGHNLKIDAMWVILMAAGIMFYVITRILYKLTSVLDDRPALQEPNNGIRPKK